MFNFEVLILYMQDNFHVGFDQLKNIKMKDHTKEAKSPLDPAENIWSGVCV